MPKNLSKHKFRRLAEESLRNALRLHADSILLFTNRSYPSAFQLSVLALEEFAKAKWVDHYYYSSITNEGLPDTEFEQRWLNLLYLHPEKQFAFLARELFDYSPKFVQFVQDRELEFKKQRAIYVGLSRSKGKVDTSSRVSVPDQAISQNSAKKIISVVNQEFLFVYEQIQNHDTYWGIDKLNEVIEPEEHQFLWCWPHRSGIKSSRWRQMHGLAVS